MALEITIEHEIECKNCGKDLDADFDEKNYPRHRNIISAECCPDCLQEKFNEGVESMQEKFDEANEEIDRLKDEINRLLK